LDMPRVEERLQRLSEEGDEPQQMCERWSKRSAFWERWCEFAVVVSRLNQLEAEAPTGNGEESTEEINELWRKRAELSTEIVDTAVATVEEASFKMTVTASLLSEGEIRVVLTPQCLGDCDRALAVDGDAEQCAKTLEPDLWTACLRVREQIAEADEDAETLSLTWWRDLRNLAGEIADYEAMTRAGLRAKGQVFQDLFDFASLMDCPSQLHVIGRRTVRLTPAGPPSATHPRRSRGPPAGGSGANPRDWRRAAQGRARADASSRAAPRRAGPRAHGSPR
jgi:hypothetical protein